MENKQEILNALLTALKLTRSQHDLEELLYHPDKETVDIIYKKGAVSVNVAMDSGIAMIRDVLKVMD